jgi:hypothetical protein
MRPRQAPPGLWLASLFFALSGPLSGTASAATFAQAQVARAIGNTIVETYPDGRMAEIWLSAGGGFEVEGRRGQKATGRWWIRNDRLCLRQLHPFLFGLSYCTPIPKVGMGQSWAARSPTGDPIQVRVVPGHETPAQLSASTMAESKRP